MLSRAPRAASLPRSAPLALAGLLLGALSVPAAAHDSVEFMAARRAPVPGAVVVGPSGMPEFTSNGVSLLGWLPLKEFGDGVTGADCWGYTSGSGREYAIMTTRTAISFVEVTDPGKPQIVQTFGAVTSLWRDVKIYQTHAYWVSEGGDGVQVADLSQIDSGIVTYVGGFGDDGTSASHNVVIDEDSGFLYRTGGGSDPVEGLRVYSLANPASPQFVARWDDRYVHDAQVVTYTSGPFANRQIAFCYSEDFSGGGNPGLDILDVTNKANIFKISDAFYGNAVFSHQGWLSPDRNTLYLNDELDEQFIGTPTTTRVLDVSNLNNPQAVGSFTSGSDAIDHNLYTKGNLIFEANYRSGLRVFDATNPTNPVETAFFDTYPENDIAEFNGLWNAFPYFDSGTIAGSDLERGLFLWRLGGREIEFTLASSAPQLLLPSGDSITVDVSAQGGATIDGATLRLHVDVDDGGFQEFPLVPLGGDDYRADFPSIPCGAQVQWYLSARTTDGTTWTDPPAGPTIVYGAAAASTANLLLDVDAESTTGWNVGSPFDDATTGIWTRGDPIGTSAQPEEDHGELGSQCFFTGQGSLFGSDGENDVDDGQTTLTTTPIDLSGGDATISYWRWYSNGLGGDAFNDVFEIDISSDGGSNWVNVETVGPSGEDTIGGWFQHDFVVSDFVPPTADVRVRFVASDEGDGSIVEAAIDDFQVTRYDCETCQVDLGFGGPGSAQLSVCGAPLSGGNFATLTLENAAPNALAVLFVGLGNNPTPFKGGQLVPVPVALQFSSTTNGLGEISFPIPGGSGPLAVFAQYAYQDLGLPTGVGLSNAVQLDFQP